MPFTRPPGRLALVGVGNDLNGDDAAGVETIRRLQALLSSRSLPLVDGLLLEGGIAPENFSGVLRRFAPNCILLIDAAWLGEEPGSICWIDWQQTTGLSASTHTLPPSVYLQYLVTELNCQAALIGIQPASLEFDQPLTGPVNSAVDHLVEHLFTWFAPSS